MQVAEQLLKGQEKIMSALTDLQGAVSGLNTSISAEIAGVTAAIKASQDVNNGAVSATDAEAIVTSLTALKGTVDSETAALTAPPAPAPAV